MDKNEQASVQGDKAARAIASIIIARITAMFGYGLFLIWMKPVEYRPDVPGAAGLVCPFPAVATREAPTLRAGASSAPIHAPKADIRRHLCFLKILFASMYFHDFSTHAPGF